MSVHVVSAVAALQVHISGGEPAYVTAIVGLAGVIVGAVLNGLVTWSLGNSKSRGEARVAALHISGELMASMPPLLQIKDLQRWRVLKLAPTFGLDTSWKEARTTLGLEISKDAYMTMSVTYEGLAQAVNGAAGKALNDPITEEEGNALAGTFLALCRSLAYLGLILHIPSRLHPVARYQFRRKTQAEIEDLLGRDINYQRFMQEHGPQTRSTA
jgi:hypothetical protein